LFAVELNVKIYLQPRKLLSVTAQIAMRVWISAMLLCVAQAETLQVTAITAEASLCSADSVSQSHYEDYAGPNQTACIDTVLPDELSSLLIECINPAPEKHSPQSQRFIKIVRLFEIDPNCVVPLVKKISWLEECDPKPTHLLRTTALGGGSEQMSSQGA